jgi:hypothetical protein
VDPSPPLSKSNSLVEPHFENAWIHPFDVFELKILVQFMGDEVGKGIAPV